MPSLNLQVLRRAPWAPTLGSLSLILPLLVSDLGIHCSYCGAGGLLRFRLGTIAYPPACPAQDGGKEA